MTGPARLRLIGQERDIRGPGDWNRSDWPRLWLYSAHYFDDLAASDAGTRSTWHRTLMQRWIRENPPGHGCGWEPYPTSLRIVNWVRAALSGPAPLSDTAIHSLAIQARFLRDSLEFHLLGNHLWANAKALVFAGSFFEGDEPDRWRKRGLALVRTEMAEQILPDGGHFERSPMYHAIVLEDLLDLVQLAAIYPGLFEDRDTVAWREAAGRMLRWLHVMSHPDGDIAFFNDAAFAVAPNVARLEEYARRQGLQEHAAPATGRWEPLTASGYYRCHAGPAVLIADAAAVGPDYIPGHAHADTLSFELSLNGRRLVVNGGTSTYEPGPERVSQRGTAMHNTVAVDDENSTEVWGAFRVARRARPFNVSWGSREGLAWMEASHDGYRRLPGRVTHSRRWELRGDTLRIVDRIDGRFNAALSRLRFAPSISVCLERPGSGVAEAYGRKVRWEVAGAKNVAVIDGTWHPRFNESLSCQILESSFGGQTLVTTLRWQ